MVELAVPRFVRAILFGCGADLSLDGVEQPRAADQLFAAVGEDLEAKHVDRDVAFVEVADDPLGRWINLRSSDDDLIMLLDADAMLLKPLDDRLVRAALNQHLLGMVEQTTIIGSTMNRAAFWDHYRRHSLAFIAPHRAPPVPSAFRFFNSGVILGQRTAMSAVTRWALLEISRSSSDHHMGQHMIADQDYFQVWTNSLYPGICQELPWEWNHCEYWDAGFPRRGARVAHFSNFCKGPAPDTATRLRSLRDQG